MRRFRPFARPRSVDVSPAYDLKACTELYDSGFVIKVMDDPSTLRTKAAQFFERAAAAMTANEAEELTEVGCQLELWANDLEEMLVPRREQKHPSSR
jgi:hypothetical protein